VLRPPRAYFCSIMGEGLPEISGEKTYDNKKKAIATCVGHFFGQLGAFFGCFFGIKGPGNQWPYAWWSFCFFVNAIAVFRSRANTTTAKIVRTQDSMTLLNLYGGMIVDLPVKEIVTIRCRKSCGCNFFVVEMTDKWYEEQLAQTKYCKCCVCKNIWITCSEQEAFKKDHGLAETCEVTP